MVWPWMLRLSPLTPVRPPGQPERSHPQSPTCTTPLCFSTVSAQNAILSAPCFLAWLTLICTRDSFQALLIPGSFPRSCLPPPLRAPGSFGAFSSVLQLPGSAALGGVHHPRSPKGRRHTLYFPAAPTPRPGQYRRGTE